MVWDGDAKETSCKRRYKKGALTLDKSGKVVAKKNEKRSVWEREQYCTAGGLTRDDLTLSKSGKPVSKVQQKNGRMRMRELRNRGKAAKPFKKGRSRSRSRSPLRGGAMHFE